MIHHTKLKFRECLKRRRETKYIVVHHTAVTGDEQPVTLVHQWHLNRKTKDGKPWAGICYHYYIRKDGEIDICKHCYLDKRTTCPGKNFPFPELIKRVHDQKQRFIDLYGDSGEVNYKFLLKKLD